MLPLPAHAWQQTYRSADGRSAVALVLDYPSTAKATELVSTLGSMLAKCAAPASLRGLTTARTVATLAARSSALVQDTRREVGPDAASQTWDESIVRTGNRAGSSRPDQATVTAGIRAGTDYFGFGAFAFISARHVPAPTALLGATPPLCLALNALTALRVLGPKTSFAGETLTLSADWTAATAGPVSPLTSVIPEKRTRFFMTLLDPAGAVTAG